MIGQFQGINGYQDKHSNPVFKHCKNPDKWEIQDSRFIMFRYGEGDAIDIKMRENNSDGREEINITVDKEGKLEAHHRAAHIYSGA